MTPTKSDTDASVEYLDASDATITDADGMTTGQQVALDVGANTIKVKVTAEDAMTTQTYTVTVNRAMADTVTRPAPPRTPTPTITYEGREPAGGFRVKVTSSCAKTRPF